jgi:GT2 family glycosyltransferase
MHPEGAVDLSIIIVNWNTEDLLRNCLASIFNFQIIYSFEVWVVDNASSDHSVAMLRKEFPQVRLVQLEENIGFARANNIALEQHKGEFVLLLNSDTLVKPEAINLLVNFLKENGDAGAVGPYLYNRDGSLQISCYPFPTLLKEFWRLFHLDTLIPYGEYQQEKWDMTRPREIDALKGACILFRKQTLDETGFFDPIFFMYTEEIDLCYRVRNAGWKLFFLPAAGVVHFGGQSTRLVADDMFQSLYRTKILFFRKHYGKIGAFIYKIILFLASIPRLFLPVLARFESGPKKKESMMLSRRYMDLIRSLARM